MFLRSNVFPCAILCSLVSDGNAQHVFDSTTDCGNVFTNTDVVLESNQGCVCNAPIAGPPEAAIVLETNSTLDLNGFALACNANSVQAPANAVVRIDGDDCSVSNGTILGSEGAAVGFDRTGGAGVQVNGLRSIVHSLTIKDTLFRGIYISSTAMSATLDSITITRETSLTGFGTGIVCMSLSLIHISEPTRPY